MRLTLFVLISFLFFNSLFARTPVLHGFEVKKDVEWAIASGISLKMDIYSPVGQETCYPVMVIYHGGGWLINQKEIMDSLSVYLVTHANYVVCNVNYRLLGDNNNSITIKQQVEDALGAVVWVKEHIAAYRGDSTRIGVTGDSAGGHLAAMVAICSATFKAVTDDGFIVDFVPSYLPESYSATSYVAKGGVAIKAAVLSYPALNFHQEAIIGFETFANPFWSMAGVKPRGVFGDSVNVFSHPEYYKAMSPQYLVPTKSQRVLPVQFCMVGSLDVVTPPSMVKKYKQRCEQQGQAVDNWKYCGKPHAFLDSKKNVALNIDFTRDAPKAIDKMIEFLNGAFY